MAGITVHLDGKRITTVNLTGLEVVDVSTHGALDQNPKASLSVSGGTYTDTDAAGHWTWVAEMPLQVDQVVKISFVEECEAGERGKTVQELFPDEEPCDQTDFSITPAMALEIRARPRLHEGFSVRAQTSLGHQSVATSDERNTSFSFRVLWDWTRPGQARVRLGTHCLDNVLERTVGSEHLQLTLSLGDSASFTLLS